MKLNWSDFEVIRRTKITLREIMGNKTRKGIKLEELAVNIGFSKGKVFKKLQLLQEVGKISGVTRPNKILLIKIEDDSLVTTDDLLKSGRFLLVSVDDPMGKRLERLSRKAEELTSLLDKKNKEIIYLKREIESLKKTGKTLEERIEDNLTIYGD
jgi:hypothetical protein